MSFLSKSLLAFDLFLPGLLSAQITGQVFRDINGNGRSDKTLPVEKGSEGILAYVFNATLGQDQLFTQTRTDVAGRYKLAVPAGQAVRVVFGSRSSRCSAGHLEVEW